MSPKEVVEKCEVIMKENRMAGIVVVMDSEDGFYTLKLPHDSLFEWNSDDTKVRLSLAEASKEQIEEEFHTLEVLETMMSYCGRAVESLQKLLYDSVNPKTVKRDKSYDN